jgi:hypothetical protein
MDITEEEKQKIKDKFEKLKSSNFKQQTLPAWRPVPTYISTTILFFLFGSIFLTLGIIMLKISYSIYEEPIRYDDHECALNQICVK